MTMTRVLRRFIKTLGNITCIVAAIILVAASVMMFAHVRPAVVVSGSMEPAVHTGSRVFIDTTYRDVKERDIIAFETGGVFVTHRVVQVTDEGYVTKGDANGSEDPGILPQSALRGRVVMWLPWLGYAAKTMSTPAGITAIVAFYAMLMLLYRLTGKEVGHSDTEKNTDCPHSPAA